MNLFLLICYSQLCVSKSSVLVFLSSNWSLLHFSNGYLTTVFSDLRQRIRTRITMIYPKYVWLECSVLIINSVFSHLNRLTREPPEVMNTQVTIRWVFRRVDFSSRWASEFETEPSECHFPMVRGLGDGLFSDYSNDRFRGYQNLIKIKKIFFDRCLSFEPSKHIEYMQKSRFEHRYLRFACFEQLI